MFSLKFVDEKHLRKIVELHRIHLFNILTQHKAIFLSEVQGSKHKGDDLNGIAALSCWLKEKVCNMFKVIKIKYVYMYVCQELNKFIFRSIVCYLLWKKM